MTIAGTKIFFELMRETSFWYIAHLCGLITSLQGKGKIMKPAYCKRQLSEENIKRSLHIREDINFAVTFYFGMTIVSCLAWRSVLIGF